MHAGYVPVMAPPFVITTLAAGYDEYDEESDLARLDGIAIAVKYDEADGGWCVGYLSADEPDHDETFAVVFTDGSTEGINLEMDKYARSADDDVGAWVLLGKGAAGRGKKRKAPEGGGGMGAEAGAAAADKKRWGKKKRSKAQLEAEIARMQAERDEMSDSD